MVNQVCPSSQTPPLELQKRTPPTNNQTLDHFLTAMTHCYVAMSPFLICIIALLLTKVFFPLQSVQAFIPTFGLGAKNLEEVGLDSD